MENKLLNGHINEETAYLVDDYPYGYRLRTKIRYWIESNKGRGDRFCSQTLNPKTGKWNKPKKGTYSAILVMGKKDNGHIGCRGLSYSTDEEAYKKFIDFCKDFEFNDLQKESIKLVKAYIKAYEGVTFECHAVKYKNKYTGEISTQIMFGEFDQWEKCEDEIESEKENEKAKETISKLVAYHYHNDSPLEVN